MRTSKYMTLGMVEPIAIEHEPVEVASCSTHGWPLTVCGCYTTEGKKKSAPKVSHGWTAAAPPKPKPKTKDKKYKVGHKTFSPIKGWDNKLNSQSSIAMLVHPQIPYGHIADENGKNWCNYKPHHGPGLKGHADPMPTLGEILAEQAALKEAKKVKTDVDEDEEVEVTDCCSVPADDVEMCVGCDYGTCVDCCSISHCEGCFANLSYSQCEISDLNCKNCCGCKYCESCYEHQGPDPDDDDFCHGCYQCSGCGCSCEKSSGGFGSMETTPWEARGIEVLASEMAVNISNEGDEWKTIWEIDDQVDPAAEMANFYLLDGIAHMVFNGGTYITRDPGCKVIAAEAKKRQDQIVAKLDVIFQRYVDMVVGGELRHHRAVSDRALNRAYRPKAWAEWKKLREKVGVQALKDAAVLFRDFDSDSYGGEAWASCTELLIYRLDGTWDARTFVDRVFSAQHNGGSLLNKIVWKQENQLRQGINIMKAIGDCHDANPPMYSALLAVASPDVRRLFSQWWKQANLVHREYGKPMVVCPKWTDDMKADGTMLQWGRMERRPGWPDTYDPEWRAYLATFIYDGPLYVFTEFGKQSAKNSLKPSVTYTPPTYTIEPPTFVGAPICSGPCCVSVDDEPKSCSICGEDCGTTEGAEHWNKVTGEYGCWCDDPHCQTQPDSLYYLKQPEWSKKLAAKKASWEAIDAKYKAEYDGLLFGKGAPKPALGLNALMSDEENAAWSSAVMAQIKIESGIKGKSADVVIIDDIF